MLEMCSFCSVILLYVRVCLINPLTAFTQEWIRSLEQNAAVDVWTCLHFFLQVYIARTEGSSKGTVSWKFDFAPVGLKIKSVSVMAISQTFHTGKVSWHFQSGLSTTEFSGGILMFTVTKYYLQYMIVWHNPLIHSLHSSFLNYRWDDAIVVECVRLLRLHRRSRAQWWRRGDILAALSVVQTELEGDGGLFIWNPYPPGRGLTVALPNKIGPLILFSSWRSELAFRLSCGL